MTHIRLPSFETYKPPTKDEEHVDGIFTEDEIKCCNRLSLNIRKRKRNGRKKKEALPFPLFETGQRKSHVLEHHMVTAPHSRNRRSKPRCVRWCVTVCASFCTTFLDTGEPPTPSGRNFKPREKSAACTRWPSFELMKRLRVHGDPPNNS